MDDLIPGEILEDIECLDPEDSYENENDALNFDTFGVSESWSGSGLPSSGKKGFGRFDRMDMPDLKGLYLSENHSNLLNFISNVETSQDNLLNRRLDELNIESPSQKTTPSNIKRDKFSHIKDFTAWTHKTPNVSGTSTNAMKSQRNVLQSIVPAFPFDHDIKIIRDMGFFSIPACKLNTDELQFKVPDQWRPPISVNRRHIDSKPIRSGQDCLFMSASEFDNILRIQLAQVSKNPKLQNYSGRWNFKLMVNNSSWAQQSDIPPDNNPESVENNNNSVEPTDENASKIKCFGRTSVACVRHGRKLIYLENNEKSTNEVISPHKRAKWAIEDCYEQLYIILELIDSIKSGVGSMEKIKAVRDQKLISLYESLTQTTIDQFGSNEVNTVFEEILNLEKGKKMVLRISKTFKPTLKINLVLEILKCRTLIPLLTQPTYNYDSGEHDYTIDLFNFVCSSIDQVAIKKIPNFVASFLKIPNVNELLSKLAETKYGVSLGVVVGNKIIQGLETGQLSGNSCKIFVDLISSQDETLSPILERIKELINNMDG